MPPPVKVKIERIVELKEKYLSNHEVAKILNISKGSVSNRYNEYLKGRDNDMVIEDLGTELSQAVEETLPEPIETKPEKPRKPATKPWEPDNNPWALDMLKLTKKRRGFRVRFFRGDDESIQKRQQQGWIVANCKDYDLNAKILGEEGKLDTTVRRRELVLMELPEELGLQRDAYVRHKTDRQTALKSADALREYENLKRAGVDQHLTVEKDTLEDERRYMENRI